MQYSTVTSANIFISTCLASEAESTVLETIPGISLEAILKRVERGERPRSKGYAVLTIKGGRHLLSHTDIVGGDAPSPLLNSLLYLREVQLF